MSTKRRLSPLVRNLAALAALGLTVAISAVLAAAMPAATFQPPPAPAGAPAPSRAAPTVRFEALDVFIDAGARPLAAWQLEVTGAVPAGEVKIVGIEGGAHKAFEQPPYYDPAAMTQNRVILAALSAGQPADLPTGRVRVARVHIQIVGTRAAPEYSVRLIAAADVDAAPITVPVSIEPFVPVPEKRP